MIIPSKFDIPLRTERNAIAFGSVTLDPVLHATAVTNKGEEDRRCRMRLNSPASSDKQLLAIRRCVGSAVFACLSA